MCRIGAVKSKKPVYPSTALRLMLPQQEGHDNSGFAMVMQDLAGVFSLYKDKPLLSMACTKQGARLVEDYMSAKNFVKMAEWLPVPNKKKDLDIQAMPYYIFRNYDSRETLQLISGFGTTAAFCSRKTRSFGKIFLADISASSRTRKISCTRYIRGCW